MKQLCGKQRAAVKRDLTIAYRHVQRAADLVKGAYGSHYLYNLVMKAVLSELGSLVDMSSPLYNRWGVKLENLVPPWSRRIDRMGRMTRRQLGLLVKEVEE